MGGERALDCGEQGEYREPLHVAAVEVDLLGARAVINNQHIAASGVMMQSLAPMAIVKELPRDAWRRQG
jgi:hypothetical protein